MRRGTIVAVVVVVFVAACLVDAPVAEVVRRSGLAGHVRGSRWAEGIKLFGTFWYAVAAAMLVWAGHLWQGLPARGHDLQNAENQTTGLKPVPRPAGWRLPVMILLAGAIGGLNAVPKWVVGQMRPFKPDGTTTPRPFELHWFWNGLPGLFHESDLSFPSGHATEAAAIGVAIAFSRPKWTWVVAGVALIVGVERVIENAHYVDNVVAGWALGCVSAVLARWMVFRRAQKVPPRSGGLMEGIDAGLRGQTSPP